MDNLKLKIESFRNAPTRFARMQSAEFRVCDNYYIIKTTTFFHSEFNLIRECSFLLLTSNI